MYNVKIDGGALNAHDANIYGTHTFSKELITALTHYDKINSYTIYTQENTVLTTNGARMQKIWPKIGWMKMGIAIAELMSRNKQNIFLATNQSFPLYTSGSIIGFIHGLSFMQYPHLYPDSQKRMRQQISQLMHRARHIVVSSEKVKSALTHKYPQNKNIHTIPFGIPSAFIEKNKNYKRKKLVLFVGMNHPIKNITLLIRSFKLLITNPMYSTYKLILVGVGNTRVDYLGLSQQHVVLIPHANISLLKKLYNEAACLAVSSLYESFHFPTIEALSQGTPVVACAGAVIPEIAPYVHTSKHNPNDFCKSLQNCLTSTKHIDVQTLQTTFSWRTFAKKIVALYHA